MKLTAVESSNVAEVIWLEGVNIFLVRFHDASVYAYLEFTAEQNAAFEAAPSKGAFIGTLRNRFVVAAKDGKPVGRPEPKAPAVLNTLDEDAGRCCQKALDKINAQVMAGFQCDSCGLSFVSEMVGSVRHWRIKPFYAVLRKQ